MWFRVLRLKFTYVSEEISTSIFRPKSGNQRTNLQEAGARIFLLSFLFPFFLSFIYSFLRLFIPPAFSSFLLPTFPPYSYQCLYVSLPISFILSFLATSSFNPFIPPQGFPSFLSYCSYLLHFKLPLFLFCACFHSLIFSFLLSFLISSTVFLIFSFSLYFLFYFLLSFLIYFIT